MAQSGSNTLLSYSIVTICVLALLPINAFATPCDDLKTLNTVTLPAENAALKTATQAYNTANTAAKTAPANANKAKQKLITAQQAQAAAVKARKASILPVVSEAEIASLTSLATEAHSKGDAAVAAAQQADAAAASAAQHAISQDALKASSEAVTKASNDYDPAAAAVTKAGQDAELANKALTDGKALIESDSQAMALAVSQVNADSLACGKTKDSPVDPAVVSQCSQKNKDQNDLFAAQVKLTKDRAPLDKLQLTATAAAGRANLAEVKLPPLLAAKDAAIAANSQLAKQYQDSQDLIKSTAAAAANAHDAVDAAKAAADKADTALNAATSSAAALAKLDDDVNKKAADAKTAQDAVSQANAAVKAAQAGVAPAKAAKLQAAKALQSDQTKVAALNKQCINSKKSGQLAGGIHQVQKQPAQHVRHGVAK